MTVPVRLRSRTFWNSSTFRSKMSPSGDITAPGMLPPAALSSVSTRPYFASMASQFFCTSSWFITSVFMNSALPPSFTMPSTISLPTLSLRPRIYHLCAFEGEVSCDCAAEYARAARDYNYVILDVE